MDPKRGTLTKNRVFYIFSSNNQKSVILNQNNLVEYQFDVVDFIAHVFRDIRNDLGVVECRKMNNYAKNVKFAGNVR